MISCQASIFVLPVTYSPCNDNTFIGISKDLKLSKIELLVVCNVKYMHLELYHKTDDFLKTTKYF